MRVAIACSSFVVAALVFTGMATPQDRPKLQFEVASIRPTLIDPAQASELSQAGRLRYGPQIHGEYAEYLYMSLRQLVAEAYQVKPTEIVCPEWCLSDRFDIRAKMPAGARREESRQMLQSLLAERFKLSFHRESVEESVSALIVGRGGAKLTPSAADDRSGDLDAPRSKDGSHPAKKAGNSVSGMMGSVSVRTTLDTAHSTVRFEAGRATMADMARFLNNFGAGNGRPVVDQTGLTGHYDFAFEIPVSAVSGAPVPEGNARSDATSALSPAETASEPVGVWVLRSLRPLGLELRNTKAPVQRLVIDHVERRPSEN